MTTAFREPSDAEASNPSENRRARVQRRFMLGRTRTRRTAQATRFSSFGEFDGQIDVAGVT